MAERHVLGLSGGKDSAALAIFMRERYPELEISYFFTDTGKELPEVYEFLGKLEGFLGRKIHQLNPQRSISGCVNTRISCRQPALVGAPGN